ncbi:MAG: lamin tail domain-containing protein, partial [Cyclobacteriaceae bacterium]
MIKILFSALFVGFWSISLTGFSQQVVISEVYGGGGNTGATLKNDFIELYNPTSNPISLAGWSVQYASATGTSWQVTNLSGSIAAKGFYLIQQAQGAGGTVNLPTPDVIGTLALSATNGKVALCNSTTALTGSNPSGGNLVDLVGFGTANGFEGTVAPALTNTTSLERKANAASTASSMISSGADALLGNGFDSNNNLADFISR